MSEMNQEEQIRFAQFEDLMKSDDFDPETVQWFMEAGNRITPAWEMDGGFRRSLERFLTDWELHPDFAAGFQAGVQYHKEKGDIPLKKGLKRED